jgi:hypothetical protein
MRSDGVESVRARLALLLDRALCVVVIIIAGSGGGGGACDGIVHHQAERLAWNKSAQHGGIQLEWHQLVASGLD